MILHILFTHILELLIPASFLRVTKMFMLMYLFDNTDFLNLSVILRLCSIEYEYSSFLELDAL